MPRGSKPLFTPEQDREIVARYRDGETLRQIGDSYGVSHVPVSAALRRCGEPRRSLRDYRWQPTPENRAEVVRLWHEGLGVQKIGRQVGTGNDVVSRVLRDAGIKTRFGGTNRRFSKTQALELAAENASGVSLAELARRHDCSTTVIKVTLKRLGVEVWTKNPHDPKFWTEERIEWLREQHNSGRSQASIAAEIGYSQEVIGKRLLKLGLRPPVPRPRGADNPRWKGGRTHDANGYVRVLTPDGYAMEHRVVMARVLGRPLTEHETVHHINGDKEDNRPENLQLRQGKHGTGCRIVCLDCGSHNIGHAPL